MNDYTLAEVFQIVYKEEFAEFDNPPKHFFSRRHRKAMKAILYPHTAPEPSEKRHIPLKRRVLIVLMVVILMAFGISAGAAMIRGFTRKENSDNTEIFAVNAENAPKTIEYVYYLPEIPEGYVPHEYTADSWSVNTSYINLSINKTLNFNQHVKDGYHTHLDNERHELEEIEINGKYALYLGSDSWGTITWDNEDYVLEVSGCFTKEELIALAESAVIKEE